MNLRKTTVYSSAITLVAGLIAATPTVVGSASLAPAAAADQVSLFTIDSGDAVMGVEKTWVAPGDGTVKLEVVGAGGTGSGQDGNPAGGRGGSGAVVTSYHQVTKGVNWKVRVGVSGGAPSTGGSASAVVENGAPVSVAGGGGGAGSSSFGSSFEYGDGGDGAANNSAAGGDGGSATPSLGGKGGNVSGGNGGAWTNNADPAGAGGTGSTQGGNGGANYFGGGGGGTSSDGGNGHTEAGIPNLGAGGSSSYFGYGAANSVGGGGAGFGGGGGGAGVRTVAEYEAFGGAGGGGYGGGGGGRGTFVGGETPVAAGGGAGGSFARTGDTPTGKPAPTYRPAPVTFDGQTFGVGRASGVVMDSSGFGAVRITFSSGNAVASKPGKVRGLKSTKKPLAKKFTVSWKAPTNAKAVGVTKYRTLVNQSGHKKIILRKNLKKNKRSFTVSRNFLLRNAKRSRGEISVLKFRVRVQAINSAGVGKASTAWLFVSTR